MHDILVKLVQLPLTTQTSEAQVGPYNQFQAVIPSTGWIIPKYNYTMLLCWWAPQPEVWNQLYVPAKNSLYGSAWASFQLLVYDQNSLYGCLNALVYQSN